MLGEVNREVEAALLEGVVGFTGIPENLRDQRFRFDHLFGQGDDSVERSGCAVLLQHQRREFVGLAPRDVDEFSIPDDLHGPTPANCSAYF